MREVGVPRPRVAMTVERGEDGLVRQPLHGRAVAERPPEEASRDAGRFARPRLRGRKRLGPPLEEFPAGERWRRPRPAALRPQVGERQFSQRRGVRAIEDRQRVDGVEEPRSGGVPGEEGVELPDRRLERRRAALHGATSAAGKMCQYRSAVALATSPR